MAIIGDILSGQLRREMKSRVDEILKRGNEWNQAAQELTAALDRLTEAIQKGNFNPANLKPLTKDLRKLSKTTNQLRMAFDLYNKFLKEYLPRLSP